MLPYCIWCHVMCGQCEKIAIYHNWIINGINSNYISDFIKWCNKVQQERRLKRPKTLDGLEIGIQHQIVNALELSTPPPPTPPPTPPPIKKEKKKNNEKLFILVISLKKMVALWNSLVTWKLAKYLSNVWKPNCRSPVAVLLILFVCHVHYGSHQYSWFSRIFSTVANRYGKSTSSLKCSVSTTSIS